MTNEIAIISESDLKSKIYVIRGVQVMLDIDLAEIYGYETKRFNEQVKNNIERFDDDFRFQLTDIAKYKSDEPNAVIQNWMRNRNTIEYLGIWETLYNPDFKPLEFEGVRKEAGLNAFTLSPSKWVDSTNAKGEN